LATPDRLDPTLIATLDAAESLTAVDLWEAQFARTDCFSRLQSLFERFDLIASPTLAAPALAIDLDPHGDIEIDEQNAGTIRGAWYPYTFPFNLTGHPAISLPCGLSADGLPIGLHLAGRWNEDRLILDVSAELEAVLAFDGRSVLAGSAGVPRAQPG
jgi:aspartyl-tRNA(Asn)/glutamyl-tRNA(Gln) amidotransferase subunit A